MRSVARRGWARLGPALFALVVVPVAPAAADDGEIDPAVIDELVVTGDRIERDETQSTAVLDRAELDRQAGKNLASILESVPGVSVLRSGAVAKPIVRGQSGSRVLVLEDGVRLESQDWGLDHAPEIDPFSAGEIRVVKGSAGVRYGPDAIAGVLLVDSLPLLDAPGLEAATQLVGASNGRRGTGALRIDGAPGWLDGLAWRLLGNYSRGADLETPDYPLENTALEEWNLGGTLGYETGALSTELSYRHNDLRNGIFLGIQNESTEDFFAQLEADEPNGVELYDVDYDIDRPYQDVSHDLLRAKAAYDAGSWGEVEGTYAYQINRRREFDVVRSSVTGAQADFELSTHTVDLAHDHAPIELSRELALEGTWGVSFGHQENVFEGLPLIPNYRSFGVGVFVIERVPFDAFELSFGGRYDHLSRDAFLTENAFSRQIARGGLTEGDCSASGEAAKCASSFDTGSVTLGVRAPVTDTLTALLDFSTASRFPTIDEQYINGTIPSLPVFALGDPSLGVETSYGLSGSLQLSTSRVLGELSAYGSYVDDYIEFGPEIGPDGEPAFDVLVRGSFPRFRYRAVDALFWGGEASGTLFLDPFELSAQVAIVRARNVEDDEYLIFIPPDRYGADLTYRVPDGGPFLGSWVTLSGAYVDEQTRVDEDADLAPPPPGYFLLGASLGTEVDLDGQRITLSVEGENLLDESYRDYTSLLRYFADEPGRQVYLRLGAEPNL